jgi:hypothetical protein
MAIETASAVGAAQASPSTNQLPASDLMTSNDPAVAAIRDTLEKNFAMAMQENNQTMEDNREQASKEFRDNDNASI